MGLTGAVEVIWCTCIMSIALAFLPQDVGDFMLWSRLIGSTGCGKMWGSASAMTFSFPLKYSYVHIILCQVE